MFLPTLSWKPMTLHLAEEKLDIGPSRIIYCARFFGDERQQPKENRETEGGR
jgi:hypothetical protein